MAAPVINVAVEGPLDEAVAHKLITLVGGAVGNVFGREGKPNLRQRIGGFNNAARHAPWLVLVDLDNDAECAPSLRDAWLPDPTSNLCFRFAVREVEAWLMADAKTLASHLGVSLNRISRTPERVNHPKDEMVNLGRRSRRGDVREDMVPRQESGRRVGPAYASRLIEYVKNKWRPEVAANRSESLHRAILCLKRLVQASP